MKLEQIIAIVIPCILIIGFVIFHIIEFFEKNNPIYNIPTEQLNEKEVIKYIKDDLIKQENEELRKAIKLASCTSKQYEVALDQMRDCINKPIVDDLDPWGDPAWERVDISLHDEPKSKKLQPLLCKMCGGTVAKKGDNYECEYCGLRYEWR